MRAIGRTLYAERTGCAYSIAEVREETYMRKQVQRANWLAAAVSCIASAGLLGCGGSDSGDDVASGPAPLTVPKAASCAGGDKPETALQGQVPAALRSAGFGGFNCNLSLVGQLQGEGGNWSSATFNDGAGRSCAYYATAVPGATRQNAGVPVIDISDRAKPLRTASLTTPAMLDPWESLRVNDRRQILIADNGQNGAGGPEVDVYDLSGDCRSPQLLASMRVGTGSTPGDVVMTPTPVGHEGNIAPDGLTYYIGDTRNRTYHAIDITSTARPKLIASFDMKTLGLATHGLSVSNDGNRVYGVTPGGTTLTAANPAPTNGFVILDTTEVQQRRPNPKIRNISTVLFKDGTTAQHTIPITIGGKPHLVMVDEGGSGGLANEAAAKAACAAGLPPFPLARIYDISDEKNPKEISKLMLETHDPKNCGQVVPDIAGLSIFTYGSHYCSVDNRDNATALACSYFNSGVRVFDIRSPERPREIAYFNPKSAPAMPGSSHAVFGQWRAGGPDWCASRLDFDFAKKQLITMCQDNGLLILQFAPNTWPFSQSTASRSQS
jgi:hypothetical protein